MKPVACQLRGLLMRRDFLPVAALLLGVSAAFGNEPAASYSGDIGLRLVTGGETVAFFPTRDAISIDLQGGEVIITDLFIVSEDFLHWASGIEEELLDTIRVERTDSLVDEPLALVIQSCEALQFRELEIGNAGVYPDVTRCMLKIRSGSLNLFWAGLIQEEQDWRETSRMSHH